MLSPPSAAVVRDAAVLRGATDPPLLSSSLAAAADRDQGPATRDSHVIQLISAARWDSIIFACVVKTFGWRGCSPVGGTGRCDTSAGGRFIG
jgi:hypothetical protein